MKEPLTGDALSRRVAEILGWDSMPNIAHNDHLANTTVKEWCGDDVGRQAQWVYSLNKIIFGHHPAMDYYGIGTASATQKMQALVTAFEDLQGK